jgi:hypothetical protein
MPIWPYFNPGELHTQDLNAFQVFDQSERAKAEDRMKRDQLNRAAEQEAVRQAGMMEYNQLRAGGMSPEDAYFRTAGKINAGGGPTDYGLNLDRMGTSPKVAVEKPQFREVGGNLMRLDPGATDWTVAVAKPTGPDPLDVADYKSLKARERALKLIVYNPKTPDQANAAVDELRVIQRQLEPIEQRVRGTPGSGPSIPSELEPEAGSEAYNAGLNAPTTAPVVKPTMPTPIPDPTGMAVEPLGIPPTAAFKPVKEIRRKVKGSRQVAIFDANTDPPTFLRYAD